MPDEILCGSNVTLSNIEPDMGAEGDVVGDPMLDGEASAGVILAAYTRETTCGAIILSSTSGTWRVVRGGTIGDVLEIHATDVQIEPFEGHTLRFPLMVWRAVIMEPTMFP